MKDIIFVDLNSAILAGEHVESVILQILGTSEDFHSYFENNSVLVTPNIIKEVVDKVVKQYKTNKFVFDSGTTFSINDFIEKLVNQYITIIHTIIYTKSRTNTENNSIESKEMTKTNKKSIIKFSVINCILLIIAYFGIKKITKTKLGQELCQRLVNLIKGDKTEDEADVEVTDNTTTEDTSNDQ